MKTTPVAARRLLRESNPVPGDAFPDAARDRDGQAVLATILASPPVTMADARRPRWARGGQRVRAVPSGRPAIRAWKVAVPAAAITAALAGLLAVMLSATSGPQPGVASQSPDSGFASLIADLTVHPSAHPGDAAAVLHQLADAAAKQPAVPLGPVEYSEVKSWGLDLDRPLQYNLNYVSHETQTYQLWLGPDGSSLGYTTLPAGEQYVPGTIPVQKGGPTALGKARFAWYDPARLPVDIAALRRHLIAGPPTAFTGGTWICTPAGPALAQPGASSSPSGSPTDSQANVSCGPTGPSPDPVTQAIVSNALDLMTSEPLPSAVRASLLRVLADSAAQGLANAHFTDMGTVTDRAGHAGVAIGYEAPGGDAPGTQTSLQVLVFDPATGALLGREWASCTGSASSYPAAGSCTPTSYDQILQVKAVQKIPAPPKLPPVPAWTPTTPAWTPTTPSQKSAPVSPTP